MAAGDTGLDFPNWTNKLNEKEPPNNKGLPNKLEINFCSVDRVTNSTRRAFGVRRIAESIPGRRYVHIYVLRKYRSRVEGCIIDRTDA